MQKSRTSPQEEIDSGPDNLDLVRESGSLDYSLFSEAE
jgi:hypothetical protein